MAEPTNNPAPFVPQAAAASQRMADSVFDRLSAGGRPGRPEPTASHGTPAKPGPAPLTLQTVARSPRPLRARDVVATEPKERAPAAAEPPSFPTVVGTWQPPEVARAGLRARDAAEADRPLWSVLPAVQIEPIIAAVESVIGKGAGADEAAAARQRQATPAMPVLLPPTPDGSASGQADSDGVSRATINASLRMLEALRAHASTHATAGDQRISLGDMTLIAFAEKRQQLAAATANSMPDPKEPDRPLGHMPNPKVQSNKNSILHKIRELAEEINKKDDDSERDADTRYGGR